MSNKAKYIKMLIEQYYDSTEQMNMILKNARSLEAAAERNREARSEFMQSVIGKATYRKYVNGGMFAPVPLYAIGLTFQDFADLTGNKETDYMKVAKMIETIHDRHYRYEDMSYDMEYTDRNIHTNIVFKTMDDMIDFFHYTYKAFTKVFRTDYIDWRPFVKKFRKYLG